MGKRGPKKTPTATLERRGSWRAKERAGEPEAPVGSSVPKPPKSVSGEAREIWVQIAPTLWASGRLSLDALRTFERYCRTYALWHRVMETAESGMVDREVALTLQKLDEQVRRLEAGFGLTPADRAELAIPEQKDDGGKGRFFNKPRIVA